MVAAFLLVLFDYVKPFLGPNLKGSRGRRIGWISRFGIRIIMTSFKQEMYKFRLLNGKLDILIIKNISSKNCFFILE